MANTTTVETSGETLEQRLAKFEEEKKSWENQRRGMISDLQQERDKRHTLEEKVNQIEASLTATGTSQTADELIAEFAKDPDSYIQAKTEPLVESRVKSFEDRLAAMEHQRRIDQAYAWLAEQENKSVSKVVGGETDMALTDVVSRHNLQNSDPLAGVQIAYKIYLQEKAEKELQERARQGNVTTQSTERAGTSNTGTRSFKRSELARMSLQDYEKNREAIYEAQAKGLITND